MKRVIILLPLTLLLLVGLTFPVLAENRENWKQLETDTYWDDCLGEYIEYEIIRHYVECVTEDGNGGTHVSWQDNINGTAIGLTSGNKYKMIGNGGGNVNVKPPYPYSDTYRTNLKLISQGKAPNSKAHLIYHLTINANGTYAVEFNKIISSCK